MDGTNFKDIVEYIRSIAEPMVTSGYEVVLKQVQFVLAWNIFGLLASAVALWFLIKFVKLSIKKIDDDYNWIGGVMFGVLGCLASLGIMCSSVYYVLNALINPDWMAIQMILGMIQ